VADFDKTVTGLRRWTKDHDPHVRAAVELLIDLGPWLHRGSFLEACVRTDHGETWIDWGEAREYAARRGLPASTTEIGLLRLAVSLGSDEYRLSRMGDAHAQAIARAFADALGVPNG